MNKYRIEYCEENGIKVKEFNKYNLNNYTDFLEKKLEAINYTPCRETFKEDRKEDVENSAYGNWFDHQRYG
jgi:hypothetical protein